MRGACYDQYRLWDRQDKFSWAGIASAGLAPFVSSGLSGKFGAAIGGFGRKLVANTASGIVGAAAESLISGADFGDNLIAALPSVIGNTIGNLAAEGIASAGRSRGGGAQTGAGDGTAAQPQPGAGGDQVGGSADEIIVTAQYRPDAYSSSLFQFAQYRPNPRARMGGNGGPPLNDPMTLQQVFPGLQNAPGGAVIGLLDNIFDLTGPANALTTDLSKGFANLLIDQIQTIDPSYRYDFLEPGGFPSTSQGQMNAINNLRLDRAEAFYRIGKLQPLQTETLRFLQANVDAAYADGVKLYEGGGLKQYLGREEAIGNYVDGRVRGNLRQLYNGLGISTALGQPVRVNNRAYNTSGTERTYTIPDSRVGDIAFDVTLTPKTPGSAQIRGFFNSDFKPSAVVIVRPSQLGQNSTYIIKRPR